MLKILKMVFGKTLYDKRIGEGLTQSEMAAKCCISVRQYSDLENGKRLPGLQNFINIVIICSIDVNDLIRKIIANGYKVDDDRNAA